MSAYLRCKNCNELHELQLNECASDFVCSACGGNLEYVKFHIDNNRRNKYQNKVTPRITPKTGKGEISHSKRENNGSMKHEKDVDDAHGWDVSEDVDGLINRQRELFKNRSDFSKRKESVNPTNSHKSSGISVSNGLSYVEEKISTYNRMMIMGTVILFIGVLALFTINFFSVLIIPGIIIVFYGYSNRSRWMQGYVGERIVAQYLNDLKECFIFHDVTLPNGRGNIDHLVVCKKGLYLIETKNYTGSYLIDGNDWFINKGYKEVKINNSPGNQVKWNAVILKEYFKSNGVEADHVWINCLVAFVSGRFKIRGKLDHYYILRPPEIASYIEDNKQALDNQIIKSLIEVLFDYSSSYFYNPEEWPESWELI